MTKRLVLTLVAACAIASTGGAQKFVHQKSVSTLPSPVLLDTTGMFLARYARVGDDMFIAGQPTPNALRALKEQGVTTVVNLRMPQEMERVGFDEKTLVEELGMKYVYIPMRGAAGENAYSPQNLSKFTAAMQEAEGKVLLHCTVAWRASHIWAAYLIQRGVPDTAAVLHARAINLMDEHRMDDSGQQPIEMFLGRKVTGLGRPSPSK